MSGWSTVTVDASSEEDAERLAERFEDRHEDNPHAKARGTRVEAMLWGWGAAGSAKSILRDSASLWESAVVMKCNDTSDSGSGSALVSDGSVESVASASGAEGALGRDAAANLEEWVDGHVYMR